MRFERPTEKFQCQKVSETAIFLTSRGMRGHEDHFLLRKPPCSLQVELEASKLHCNKKIVWAIRDNDKMMLEVILEAWFEKIEQKYVFPN